MDKLVKIPDDVRCTIDELVKLKETRYKPGGLVRRVERLCDPRGGAIGGSFFKQVYIDLCSVQPCKYAASSAPEFKLFLEAEYVQQVKAHAERQAQAQMKEEAERQAREKAQAERQAQEQAEAERRVQALAREREESKRRARAEFEALGEQIAITFTREELVELGRKRADLAFYTGDSYVYENHCWACTEHISSGVNVRCPNCRWYICTCGACGCGFSGHHSYYDDQDSG